MKDAARGRQNSYRAIVSSLKSTATMESWIELNNRRLFIVGVKTASPFKNRADDVQLKCFDGSFYIFTWSFCWTIRSRKKNSWMEKLKVVRGSFVIVWLSKRFLSQAKKTSKYKQRSRTTMRQTINDKANKDASRWETVESWSLRWLIEL